MARREITDKVPWDEAYRQVAYTVDALALAGQDGDEEVGALGTGLEVVLAGWEEIEQQRHGRLRELGRALALVKRRELQADAAVTALHNDALAHVKLNRKAPLFSQLFPDAQSVFERRPLEGLLLELRRMETVLTESETPAPLRGAHLHRVRRAITRGEEALREREEARGRESELVHRIIIWRDETNAALRDTQEKLAAIAFDRRFGKEWVETYFPNSLPATA